MFYLWSEVRRDPQRKLCSCGVLPEVQQPRRVSVVQCGGLTIIGHRWVTVVHRRLTIIGEWRMTEVRFDVLPCFYL